jgi:hypothetical protein
VKSQSIPSEETSQTKTAVKNRGLGFWREPLVHFFVLGLVVFGLYAALEKRPEPVDDPFLVEVSSADIEWIRTMWSKRMGREPTVKEMRGTVNQMIREQILSREAVSLGLDEGDTVVRRRLAQKMDFLLKGLSDIREPTEDELRSYLQENRAIYEIPAEVTFTQIYFSSDKRGEEGAERAVRLVLEGLADKGVPSNVSDLGDPFLLAPSYSNKTLVEIRGEFGHRFAEAVWNQEPRRWHGPVGSGYGLHAVFVHERSDASLPVFSEVKDRLRADWMSEKQREIARNAYQKVRSRYRVLLEGMPYDLDMSG